MGRPRTKVQNVTEIMTDCPENQHTPHISLLRRANTHTFSFLELLKPFTNTIFLISINFVRLVSW